MVWDPPHEDRSERAPDGGEWVPCCSCGWQGTAVEDEAAALNATAKHARPSLTRRIGWTKIH